MFVNINYKNFLCYFIHVLTCFLFFFFSIYLFTFFSPLLLQVFSFCYFEGEKQSLLQNFITKVSIRRKFILYEKKKTRRENLSFFSENISIPLLKWETLYSMIELNEQTVCQIIIIKKKFYYIAPPHRLRLLLLREIKYTHTKKS